MLGEKKRLQRYATCTFAFSPVCNFTCMTFRREFSLICYHCGDLRRRFWKSPNSCSSLFQNTQHIFWSEKPSWTWSVEVNNKIEKLKKHFWNTRAFQPLFSMTESAGKYWTKICRGRVHGSNSIKEKVRQVYKRTRHTAQMYNCVKMKKNFPRTCPPGIHRLCWKQNPIVSTNLSVQVM